MNPNDRHAAVAAATSRTRHLLGAHAGARDARYTAEDPAVDRVWLALHEVSDPELPVSLVDLGLVYDVRRVDGAVEIHLTFTATALSAWFARLIASM